MNRCSVEHRDALDFEKAGERSDLSEGSMSYAIACALICGIAMSLMRCLSLLGPIRELAARRLTTSALVQAGCGAPATQPQVQPSTSDDTVAAVKVLRSKLTQGEWSMCNPAWTTGHDVEVCRTRLQRLLDGERYQGEVLCKGSELDGERR